MTNISNALQVMLDYIRVKERIHIISQTFMIQLNGNKNIGYHEVLITIQRVITFSNTFLTLLKFQFNLIFNHVEELN